MTRALCVLIGAAVCSLALQAVAQDSFPDVPMGHWAYDALKTLRDEHLLVGYPDGKYRGDRPLSRYEFAVAANAAYTRLRAISQGLTSRLDELERAIDEIQVGGEQVPEVTKDDLAALQEELEAVKAELAGLSVYKESIEALQKLAREFERDMASLGVDVAAMQRELRSMGDRVAALEARKPAVDVHGDVTAFGIGKHSIDSLQGVDWTGNPVGTDASGNPAGLTDDLHFAGELGLQLGATAGRDVHLTSDITVGGVLGYEFSSFSRLLPGIRKTEGYTDVFVNRLSAEWASRWFGNPVDIEVGRLGHKISPYILWRLDPDPYVDIPRYDNGEWAMDGAKVSMDFETVALDIFAGRQGARGSLQAWSAYMMTAGDNRTFFDYASRPAGVNQGLLTVQTELGANIDVDFGRSSAFELAYVLLDGDRTVAPPGLASGGFTFNRVGVLGGGLRVGVAESLFVDANFAQAQLMENGSSRLNRDNFAYDVGLRLESGEAYDFGVGWREIRPFFAAPGYWGRIGFWNSPTDLKGLTVGGSYRFGSSFDVTAQGEFYQGTGRAKDTLGAVVGLGTDDRVNRLQLGVGYRLAARWKVLLGWEGVYWDLKDRPAGFGGAWVGGKPSEYYYTLGLNYGLGQQTNLRLLYQISDYDGKNITGFNTPGNSDTRAKGGILVTQFSVEF
jgi:hypothetical protein